MRESAITTKKTAMRSRIFGQSGCAKLARKTDWSKTGLGPIEEWSAELVSQVNTILNSPVAYVLLCGDDGTLIYNDGYAVFAGAKHPSIFGMPATKAWPEIADFNRDIMRRIKSGETISYKNQMLQLKRHKKLEDVYLDLTYGPLFSANGDINGVEVSVVDTTERQRIEADLIKTKRMFDSLFNSSIVAFATVRMNGNITQVNDTFLKLFGYTKADIKAGLNSSQFPAKGDEHKSKRLFESLRMRGEAEPTERRYVRKDGSEFPALVGAALLEGGDDEFMAFILDTSENEQLKEINKTKDEFIALASHQLRSPATAVKQYIGILMNEYAGPVSGDQLQYLTIANNANNRQLTLINDLLKTAQIDSRGYRLNVTVHDLVQIVTQTIEEHEPMLDSKNQKIAFESNKPVVKVPVDKLEIGICIANLIENASKYSPAKSTIKLKLEAKKDLVELSIKDKGVGIALKDRKKIFDKFTRIDNALSDTVSGSGLGLYWVKRIVKMHKGELKITSTLGKGTTFVIRLYL